MSCKETIKTGLARRPFHRSLQRHRECSARHCIGQTLGRRHAAQPATDKRGAEAVASSRRIDLLDFKPGLDDARDGVEVASTVSAALVDNRLNAAAQNFRDGGFLFFWLRKKIEFDAARQEKIATPEQGSQASRRPGRFSISGRKFGSNEIVPPRAFTVSAARRTTSTMLGEKRAVPITWRWSLRFRTALAAASRTILPEALCLMLYTKARDPSGR